MKIELKPFNKINPNELAYHANDINVQKYLRNFPYPYTLNHALHFIAHSLKNQNIEYAIVVDDICVGCISAQMKKDIYMYNCEIGYWLSSHYWNQGIMSQVVRIFCHYLFTHYPIHKICAEVFVENIGSYHVLTKNGFVQEGHLIKHVYKDNTFHDIILLGLRSDDFEY